MWHVISINHRYERLARGHAARGDISSALIALERMVALFSRESPVLAAVGGDAGAADGDAPPESGSPGWVRRRVVMGTPSRMIARHLRRRGAGPTSDPHHTARSPHLPRPLAPRERSFFFVSAEPAGTTRARSSRRLWRWIWECGARGPIRARTDWSRGFVDHLPSDATAATPPRGYRSRRASPGRSARSRPRTRPAARRWRRRSR